METGTHNDLEQFLGEQASVGRLESEGVFTLAESAALKKLANFQLPRASAWILKVLQAAVASGAESLMVVTNSKATRFVFEPKVPLSLEELRVALLEVEHRASRPLTHLATGLRAVGFGDSRPFTLVLDGAGERTLFAWDGDQLVSESRELPGGAPSALHLAVSFPAEDAGRALGGLVRGAGRASAEFDELSYRGQASPIRLTFDGRRLDTMLGAPPEPEDHYTSLLSLNWWDPDRSPNSLNELSVPPGLRRKQREWRLSDRFTAHGAFTLVGDPSLTRCRGLAKLNYHYYLPQAAEHGTATFKPIPRPSLCHFLIDGAIASSGLLAGAPSPVSCELFLDATDLPTDLTGLSPRPHAALRDRQSAAIRTLLPQVEATDAALERHIPKPFNRDLGLLAGLALGSAVLLPPTALLLVGSALAPMLLFSSRKKGAVVGACRRDLHGFAQKLPRR